MFKVKNTKRRLKAGKAFLSVLCCFFAVSWATAQEKLLKGKITNSADIEGIHILNRTSRFNTITDSEGNFEIYANRGDTLFISSVTYIPEKLVISKEIYEKELLELRLTKLVNELDEVYLGPKLTGNLETDLKNIKTEKPINFDDVGIPGYKGEPQERIPNLIGQVITPLSLDIEGLYKHINGYYKTLRTKRKWERQNRTVVRMINFYTSDFFEEAYQIPEHRLYDFLLFCIETSEVQSDFDKENYSGVLTTYKEKGAEYVSRLSEKRE